MSQYIEEIGFMDCDFWGPQANCFCGVFFRWPLLQPPDNVLSLTVLFLHWLPMLKSLSRTIILFSVCHPPSRFGICKVEKCDSGHCFFPIGFIVSWGYVFMNLNDWFWEVWKPLTGNTLMEMCLGAPQEFNWKIEGPARHME